MSIANSSSGLDQPVTGNNIEIAAPAPSFSSSGRIPTLLKPSAPPTLPTIVVCNVEAKDIRAGERGWRNIPDCVRDVLSVNVESTATLRSATIALAQAIGKRAGFAEVASALNSKASVEQLERLARYVGRDVLGRLSEPCPGHSLSMKHCSSLEQDIARLQSIVEAQDRALVAATRELGALRSTLQRKEAHDIAMENERRSGVSLHGVSKEVHQKLIEEALERAHTKAKEHSESSLEKAKLHSENLYAKRIDLIEALVNDIRVMSNKLQSLADDSEPRDLRMAKIEASLRRITDDFEAQASQAQANESLQKGVKTSSFGSSDVTHAADAAVKSRMAMLSTAFDRQASSLRSDIDKSVRAELASLREEIEASVKGKLNKTDLIRALSLRPTTDFVKEHVRSELAALQNVVERKVEKDDVYRLKAEVAQLKESMRRMEEMLMRSESQSRINSLFASSGASLEREREGGGQV